MIDLVHCVIDKLIEIELRVMPYSLLDREHFAKKELPAGHSYITKCEKAVKAEYSQCHKQEDKFMWDWRQAYALSRSVAKEVAVDLCRVVGVKPIKDLLPKEPASKHFGAYYRPHTKTIHIDDPIKLWSLAHELSHHIDRCRHGRKESGKHGEQFCKIEQELFDLLLKNQWSYPNPFSWLKEWSVK